MKYLKMPVNWVLVATLPVWGGPVLFAYFLYELYRKDWTTVQVAIGKKWFWE